MSQKHIFEGVFDLLKKARFIAIINPPLNKRGFGCVKGGILPHFHGTRFGSPQFSRFLREPTGFTFDNSAYGLYLKYFYHDDAPTS